MEEVKKWLSGLNLVVYYEGFIDNGYDDLDAIRYLEDEDLDAIGVTDPSHRKLIKTRSQQQGEAETPVEDSGGDLDFANVLSDLDSIIGELGAFGNPSAPAPSVKPKPTVAPKPVPKPFANGSEPATKVTVVSPVKRTSTVFVETETGQTRIAEEDFDLDSLLYDIVKFDPNKIVQQQQQQQKSPQQLPQDVVDGVPLVKSIRSEVVVTHDAAAGEAPPSEQQEEENVETIVMPDLRSASMMISEEEVKQRLDKLAEDLRQSHTLSEAEIQQKLKDEKLRIALEKMKLANVKKVAVKIFNADGSSKTVVIEEGMTAAIVCHLLVVKNMAQESPKWALVEKWEDLGIERVVEDHEIVVDIYCTWPRQNSNTFIFKHLDIKYDLFENPIGYFPSHLSLSAESAYKHGAQERAEKARKILLQEYFSSTHRVPEIEGILYSKEGYKKPWKKFFFILRSSGVYYSTKGKSKLPKNLRVFVQFEGHDVYYGVGLKKMLTAPSDYCFCLKSSAQVNPPTSIKDAKVFCCESEQLLKTWVAGIRLAKYGLQLRDNYHKSHVTQFKLEEMEGGGGEQTVEQRQQKLTGMIAETHIDKVRQEYQQQQKQQMEEQEQSRIQLAKQMSVPASSVKQPSPVPVTGVVKPASAGFSYPKAPSEDLSNGSHSVLSPVHHPRVLPAVPIKQSSGGGHSSGHVASSPAQVSSPPALSTSLPAVSSSHFVPSQPSSLQSFPWFHGDISRDIAVKRLEEYSMTDGTFLIRTSKSCVGTYVLTMAAEGIIRNFQIQPHSSGSSSMSVLYRIDDGPEFSTIQQLINHYAKDADRLPCKLSHFCPK